MRTVPLTPHLVATLVGNTYATAHLPNVQQASVTFTFYAVDPELGITYTVDQKMVQDPRRHRPGWQGIPSQPLPRGESNASE